MMRRKLVCLVTGLLFVGIAGAAQAAGCDNGEDFFTEGPSYKRDCTESTVVQTKVGCVDQESFFVEGMRTSPCVKEAATIALKADNPVDMYIEGFSNDELENMKLIKILNNTETAAGI